MVEEILEKEAYYCYKFLIDHTNFEENSSGYGATLDRTNSQISASIAGSGFMLSGLVIGVKNKWDDFATNLKRAKLTLKNFYENIPHFEGMFSHYVEFLNGKRYRRCEYSTIDTALFLNGMLVVDSFFDDDEIHLYTKKIYERIDWNKFIFTLRDRFVFRMAYNDILGGDYLGRNQQGWIYHWSMFAEQLSLYILAAGSEKVDQELAKKLFLGFERTIGGYKNNQYVYTPLGTLFVHQFNLGWFDFYKYYDTVGYDWFKNTQNAINANYQYCQDLKDKFPTFMENLWGLSSCDGPKGYSSYGNPPFTTYDNFGNKDLVLRTDGTIALYAIFASLPFHPELVKRTIEIITEKFPEVIGKYGFYDSMNLGNELWVGKNYLSIDKGITLLMIDNYFNKTNWKYYMNHDIIKKAVDKLGFIRKEG